MNTEFQITDGAECRFKIGQKVPEFAPMNREAKFSFNETSLDIIIGIAPDERRKYLDGAISIALFYYRIIPSIIVTTGYMQVDGNIIISDKENIDINAWLNRDDDYVNLVLVDDFRGYEVKEIRRVQFPSMKTIRQILKQQTNSCEGEVQNTLSIVEKGFLTPWKLYYADEVCSYKTMMCENNDIAEHCINKPKEKIAHVYY